LKTSVQGQIENYEKSRAKLRRTAAPLVDMHRMSSVIKHGQLMTFGFWEPFLSLDRTGVAGDVFRANFSTVINVCIGNKKNANYFD
jgi:hypothetical protein